MKVLLILQLLEMLQSSSGDLNNNQSQNTNAAYQQLLNLQDKNNNSSFINGLNQTFQSFNNGAPSGCVTPQNNINYLNVPLASFPSGTHHERGTSSNFRIERALSNQSQTIAQYSITTINGGQKGGGNMQATSGFQNQTQELLSCQKKGTLANWEMIGPGSATPGQQQLSLNKGFDKIAKSFVINMLERHTRIRYPKLNSAFEGDYASTQNSFGQISGKYPALLDNLYGGGTSFTAASSLLRQNQILQGTPPSLHSIMSHSVLLQIMFPENEDFSIEFSVIDLARVSYNKVIDQIQNRRCLIITSGDEICRVEKVHVTNECAIIPNYYIDRRVWLNLVIDLKSLYNNLFRGSTFRSIEGIEISSMCKIRRVMTLNNNQTQLLSLLGANHGDISINSILSQAVIYPVGVSTQFQLFNYDTTIGFYKTEVVNELPGSRGAPVSMTATQYEGASVSGDHSMYTNMVGMGVTTGKKRQAKRQSPMPQFSVNQAQSNGMSRHISNQSVTNNLSHNSPRQQQHLQYQFRVDSFQKKKQSSQKNLGSVEKTRLPSMNKEGISMLGVHPSNVMTGFASTKSQPTEQIINRARGADASLNKRSVNQQVNQFSDANTTFSTRKKSIPSATSHTFVSTEDNFQLYSQQKASSIGPGGTQTINNSSIHGAGSDLQSTMRQSMNERTMIMHQRVNGSHKGPKDTIQNMQVQKSLKGKKAHPLSAVQRTNKLNNNLYTVVNNKLVRNVQGQQHNTNSSQQNIDRLLTEFDTSSAAKLSQSPSEERLFGVLRTNVKRQSEILGQAPLSSDGNMSQVMDITNNSINMSSLKYGQNTQQAIDYYKMKHQMLRPFNQSDINLDQRDQILVSQSGNHSSSPSNLGERDYQNSGKMKQSRRIGGNPSNPNYNHEYSTGSLPQIDEVSSPIPTGQVSRLQMATSVTPLGQKQIIPNQITQKYQSSFYPSSYQSSQQDDSSYQMNQFGKSTPGKINIFPVNKLATAIAWHEESIREENEYAENDEGILASQKSSESQRSTINNTRHGKAGNSVTGHNVRNNKLRTSQEHQGTIKVTQKSSQYANNLNQPQTTSIVVVSSGSNFNHRQVQNQQMQRGAIKQTQMIEAPHVYQQTALGGSHLNRNVITNQNQATTNNKLQQRYSSQVKEKTYQLSNQQVIAVPQVTINQGGETNHQNEKNQSKKRGKALEQEQKFPNGDPRELNRVAINKSELLPVNQPSISAIGISQGIEEVAQKTSNLPGIVGIKAGKVKAKRVNDTQKILRAYNMDQEGQVQTTVHANEQEHSKGRKKYQAASIKKKEGEDNRRMISGDQPSQMNQVKRDHADHTQGNSSRTRQNFNPSLKKSSITASKAVLNQPSFHQDNGNFTKIRVSDVNDHNNASMGDSDALTQSQFEMLQVGSSQRMSRQGKYKQQSPAIILSDGSKGEGKMFQYPPQTYKGAQNRNAFGARKQSNQKLQQKPIPQNEDQLKMLQRLNHDYDYQLGSHQRKGDNDVESAISLIEEQIDRESEIRSEIAESRKSTKRRQITGTNKLLSESQQSEDEYDVDYDNLVVSDILGTSGLPGVAGVYGGMQQFVIPGKEKGASFSLYDFT
ncbi:hypothetical protein FGO68_gene8129 [Halteria grandinella]|uniref:CFA20 domain-containing protein n=1 Tax=Halteria grandinella TaxID=5974 RepID=A0A8J8P6E0_HALGN|nr:hypothetical protein FGO68_gene8129 [Halteria grandinella]